MFQKWTAVIDYLNAYQWCTTLPLTPKCCKCSKLYKRVFGGTVLLTTAAQNLKAVGLRAEGMHTRQITCTQVI